MIDKKTSKSIWHPTIFFNNLMKKENTKFYGGTGEGTMEYFHGINQTMNLLLYVESFLLKFSCTMNFSMFPFDSNQCCLDYLVLGKL